MKKMLSVFLGVALIAAFGACDNNDHVSEATPLSSGSSVSDDIDSSEGSDSSENSRSSSSKDESSSQAGESQKQPDTGDSKEPSGDEPQSSAIPVPELTSYYMTGEDSPQTYAKAYIVFNEDTGEFYLKVLLNEADYPAIVGEFDKKDSEYVLTPTRVERWPDLELDDLGEIKFKIDGDKLIYEGDTLEELKSGAEFAVDDRV